MNILITGGAGYISSHITVALTENKHSVFLYDNLTNSSLLAVDRINALTAQPVTFIEGDVADAAFLEQVLVDKEIDLVLHTAALKQSDSHDHHLAEGLQAGNMETSAHLLQAMRKAGVRQLIYSSSAAVYGPAQYLPLDEMHPVNPIHDYGRSKLAVERMLADFAVQEPGWRILALRYFNVAGLHDSGLLRPHGGSAARNLVFHLAEVACGNTPFLTIYGDHYPTMDGTFVRDYVHVVDIAEAHLGAVNYMQQHQGFMPVNIGTGQATSVLDLVRTFEKVTGRSIPFVMQPAAYNDVPSSYADTSRAIRLLGWRSCRTLEDICLSELRWGGH